MLNENHFWVDIMLKKKIAIVITFLKRFEIIASSRFEFEKMNKHQWLSRIFVPQHCYVRFVYSCQAESVLFNFLIFSRYDITCAN